MFKLHLHKWKYVYTKHREIFLGETYYRFYKVFRICTKCYKTESIECNSEGIYWRPLNKVEKKILFKKIEDKGKYYVLKDNNIG